MFSINAKVELKTIFNNKLENKISKFQVKPIHKPKKKQISDLQKLNKKFQKFPK
jgi:hypothetical protein